MKINRELLMAKLGKAASIANYKEAKGIIKLTVECKENDVHQVSFYGADGRNTVITQLEVEATNVNVGEYFIDANKSLGYLKNLGLFGANEVELEFGDKLIIKTDNTNFDFPYETPSGYPTMPEMKINESDEVFRIEVDSTLLVSRLLTLSKTVCTDGSRPLLSYANLFIKDNTMRMRSTDGIRLFQTELNCNAIYFISEKPLDKELEFNVNPLILSRLIYEEEGVNVDMVITKDFIYVMDRSAMITMKIIDEKYPDLSDFIVEVDFEKKVPFKSVFTVDSGEMSKALKLMKAGIVNEKEKLIQFNLSCAANSVSTSKSNGVVEKGEKSTKDSGEVSLSGTFTGSDITIKFDNTKLDVLANCPTRIRMCFQSPELPVLVYDAEEERDHKFILVLIPVR